MGDGFSPSLVRELLSAEGNLLVKDVAVNPLASNTHSSWKMSALVCLRGFWEDVKTAFITVYTSHCLGPLASHIKLRLYRCMITVPGETLEEGGGTNYSPYHCS